MQRMHYVMHYVMHRVLAKMGWPSLDRVLSKMAEASLRSYSRGSYNPYSTVAAVTMAVAKCVTKCAPADLACTSHAG